MKTPTLTLLLLLVSAALTAQEPGYFTNPVIRGDVADPSMIRIGDTYYAAGTSSEWAPYYPMFMSKDLINWTQTGHVFNEKPGWASNSFWAPELYLHSNGKVYCYYTARRKDNNISYIGVASSKSPTKEFTDHGPVVEYGSESIDAFVYEDDGQLYISWKAYGLDKGPVEILGSRLSDDGLRLEGEPFTMLVDDQKIGMEGQYHFKRGDYYYIIYAARGCCGPRSDYEVYAARSKNFRGPYEKYEGNPILYGGLGDFKSCGHGTAVETPDGRLFFMCHAYLAGDGYFMGRQPILQQMVINDEGWVEFTTGRLAAARQAVPFAGTEQEPLADFADDFDDKKLRKEWSWNYPYSEIDAKLKKGSLFLAGESTGNYGTALCLRSTSIDYSIETKVGNSNDSMKGLTMYGDDNNLVLWGVEGGKLYVKVVDNGQETVVWESGHGVGEPYLKMEVRNGSVLSFYYSGDGISWLKPVDTPVDRRALGRWDRVARPGLIQIGGADAPAEFTYFKMVNVK